MASCDRLSHLWCSALGYHQWSICSWGVVYYAVGYPDWSSWMTTWRCTLEISLCRSWPARWVPAECFCFTRRRVDFIQWHPLGTILHGSRRPRVHPRMLSIIVQPSFRLLLCRGTPWLCVSYPLVPAKTAGVLDAAPAGAMSDVSSRALIRDWLYIPGRQPLALFSLWWAGEMTSATRIIGNVVPVACDDYEVPTYVVTSSLGDAWSQ